ANCETELGQHYAAVGVFADLETGQACSGISNSEGWVGDGHGQGHLVGRYRARPGGVDEYHVINTIPAPAERISRQTPRPAVQLFLQPRYPYFTVRRRSGSRWLNIAIFCFVEGDYGYIRDVECFGPRLL